MNLKKMFALLLAVGMIAACFVGCKKTPKVEEGPTLRINLASEPDRLDPALNSSVDGACLAANSFGGLYTYDANGQVVPNFAEGFELSDDGLTYTFTLKKDLKWSDGSALTAADFVYSWKRAAATETAADYSYMLNGIAGYPDNLNVTADGDSKITVVLAAPCAYMLESWTHNESMVYVKNPYWYDAANVKVTKLEFMLSADDTAIFSAYQAGNLDFIDTVPTDEIKNLKSNPEFHIIPSLGTYYVIFDVGSPLFDGKTVEQAAAMRKAIGRLINRQYIIDTVAQCEQEIATSYLPSGMADGHGGVFKSNDAEYTYPVEDGYYAKEPSVDEAIALLESAGYKFTNGVLDASTPIAFEYLTNESSGHIAIAQCIQADLAKVGITVTIKTVDWDTFLAERKAGNYDVARNGWIADFNDPINMLEMWTTESGNNDAQYGRGGSAAPDWAAFDDLIAQIKTSTDFVEREALMHAAEDILMETGALCPIYYYNDLYMQKANVSGFYASPFGTKYFMYCDVAAQ